MRAGICLSLGWGLLRLLKRDEFPIELSRRGVHGRLRLRSLLGFVEGLCRDWHFRLCRFLDLVAERLKLLAWMPF